MEKYISRKYLLENLKNFKSEILDPEYESPVLVDTGEFNKLLSPTGGAAILGIDAKGKSEQIGNYFEQGGIGHTTNANYSANKVDGTTRVRIAELIPTVSGQSYTITCNSGYMIIVQSFDTSGLLVDTSGSNAWNNPLTVTASAYMGVAIRKSDNSNISIAEAKSANILVNGSPIFAPTPSNPIPITNANPEVTAIGKNLFDGQNVTSGKYIGDDGSIGNDNPSAYTDLIMVSPNTTYTFSALSGGGGRKRIHAYDSNGNWIKLLGSVLAPSRGSAMSLTVTTPSNAKYIRLSYSFNNAYEGGANNDKNVQIEVGASASAYEEYRSNTITLPYTLRSVGNVADECVVKDGVGTKTVCVGMTTIGALDWKTSSSGNGRFYADIADGSAYTNPICSTYKYSSTAYEENTISSSKKSSSEDTLRIYVGDTRYTSASEFKSAMSNSVIYYALYAPTTETLTAEQVASILALQTYAGTTVIASQLEGTVTYVANEDIGTIISAVSKTSGSDPNKMDKVNPVGEGTLTIPRIKSGMIEATNIESEGTLAGLVLGGMQDPFGEYEGYRIQLSDDVWYATTGEFGRWEERNLGEDMHDFRFGLAEATNLLGGKVNSGSPVTVGWFQHTGDFDIKNSSDEVVASINTTGWGNFKGINADTVQGDKLQAGETTEGKAGVISLYRNNKSEGSVAIIQETLIDYKSVPPRLVEVPLVESDDSGIRFNGHTLEADVPANAKFTDTVITQSDVAGWGFTKNTGTYSKPSGGIPASDLASGVIPTTLPASDVKAWAKADSKPSYTASEVGALASTVTHLSGDIASTEKGSANGVATLGSDGKIPSSQLPSYVDDVLEYSAKSSFPATGETGKIYVNTADNKTYRWSGSAYVEISPSLALGETSSTAYAGDKGKALADKLKDIESGAQVNVQSDWNVTDTTSKAYIKNKPQSLPANGGTATNVSGTVAIANGGTGATTASGARTNLGLGGAATKGVDTSISAASTSANLPTAAAVASFVEGKGYKTTDNNTTYSLTQDATDKHKITLTPSSGTAQTITIPDNNTVTAIASTTGSGNAVTSITASNGQLTVTKGTTFLTSHQSLASRAVNTTLASDADLNTCKTPGFYNCGGSNSVANKPSGVGHFGMWVTHNASGEYYTQILIDGNDGKQYRRTCNNGTWGGWTEDKLTDTNTWRGIQNNLTSDSTTESLSAKQGKELKSLIDAINTTLNNLEIFDEEAF